MVISPSKAVDFGQYVKLDEEKKRVQSSRFFVQSGPIKDATSEMQMVQVMRSIALTSSLPNVTIRCAQRHLQNTQVIIYFKAKGIMKCMFVQIESAYCEALNLSKSTIPVQNERVNYRFGSIVKSKMTA